LFWKLEPRLCYRIGDMEFGDFLLRMMVQCNGGSVYPDFAA